VDERRQLRVTAVEAVVEAHQRVAGRDPDGVWASPGRVNLIGEHTDYNDGLVLPLAIDRTARVAVSLRGDATVRCVSLQITGQVAMAVADITPGRARGWAAYPLGVLWALGRAGLAVPGLDLVIDSEVPVGAGLGSSAAVEVAVALAVTELTGQPLPADELARCCRAGEQAIAGAPTGLMDQLAVLEGRAGHALLLDCRSLGRELVPFEPADAEATLLVIDTTVTHATSGEGFWTRRDECARAAGELGVPSLRDADLEDVERRLAGVLARRARHVVTENRRVVQAAELLRGGALQALGPLLDASHASLRDDFEVSCAELDLAVEAARSAGAWGARMTGAGFGGCAIALVPSARCAALTDAVRTAFAEHAYRIPDVFAVTSAGGARRCG
jgi:galactokinase